MTTYVNGKKYNKVFTYICAK